MSTSFSDLAGLRMFPTKLPMDCFGADDGRSRATAAETTAARTARRSTRRMLCADQGHMVSAGLRDARRGQGAAGAVRQRGIRMPPKRCADPGGFHAQKQGKNRQQGRGHVQQRLPPPLCMMECTHDPSQAAAAAPPETTIPMLGLSRSLLLAIAIGKMRPLSR